MAGLFGAAALVGVAAGLEADLAPLIAIAACLVALAILSPGALRWFTVAVAVGFVVGVVAAEWRTTSDPDSRAALPEALEGHVQTDPQLTTRGQYAVLGWTDRAGMPRESGLLLPATSSLARGQRIVIEPSAYSAEDNLIIADEVDVVGAAGRLERRRQALRDRATERILNRVPGSSGSLALGLLIGDDSGLMASEREAMRASGLSHITAVSGSNVAMLIVVVAFLLRALVRRSWLWIPPQLVAILFYVWLVGAEPPIVRAAIMGSLALVAIALGRPPHLFTLLFLAGGLMALHEPAILGSLSFQLSFLSMLALGVVGTRVRRIEGRGRQVAVIVASPAAAALATAPLIALRFGAFSLGTVPANVLVAALIAPATGLAALVAILGDLPGLGALLGVLLWLATGAILEVARFVASFPGAYWTFAPPGVGPTVLLYLLLAGLATPFVPEARLAAFRLRGWAERQPAVALSSVSAGLALLWALASMGN